MLRLHAIRSFSTGKASKSSGTFRVLKWAGITGFVGATAYVAVGMVALRDARVRSMWNENVPGGDAALERIKSLEESAKELKLEDVTNAAATASSKASETATQIQQTATEGLEKIKQLHATTMENITTGTNQVTQIYTDTRNQIVETYEAGSKKYSEIMLSIHSTLTAANEKLEEMKKSLGLSSKETDSTKKTLSEATRPSPPVPAPSTLPPTSSTKTAGLAPPAKQTEPAAEAHKMTKDPEVKPPPPPANVQPKEKVVPDKEVSLSSTFVYLEKQYKPNQDAKAVKELPKSEEPKNAKQPDASITKHDTLAKVATDAVKELKESEEKTSEVPVLASLDSRTLLVPLRTVIEDVFSGEAKERLLYNLKHVETKSPNAINAEELKTLVDGVVREIIGELKITAVDETMTLQKEIETLSSSLKESQAKLSEDIRGQEEELRKIFEEEQFKLAESVREALEKEWVLREEEIARLHEAQVHKKLSTLQKEWEAQIKSAVDNERDGRLARVDHLSAQLKSLQNIAISSGEFLVESRRTLAIQTALSLLQSKLFGQHRFSVAKEVEILKAVGKEDTFVVDILSHLNPEIVSDGVPSVAELSDSFNTISTAIRRAQVMPDHGGPISFAVSWLLSHAIIKKSGYVAGDDVESILARSETFLKAGDLDKSARELNQLRGWPKKLAADWLAQARLHLEIRQAYEVIDSHVRLNALGAV
ncbi:Formation of crista junctions protein 1 [Phlyctochytrium planicorne]|nr:Formation of crista junctions protein 1 [Phlyctochytrium planicorne]